MHLVRCGKGNTNRLFPRTGVCLKLLHQSLEILNLQPQVWKLLQMKMI